MTRSQKLLALMLALTMVSAPLFSCGGDDASGDDETTLMAETDPVAEVDPLDARKSIPDGLPSVKMDGYEFNVLSAKGQIEPFYSEEEVGEPVADSLYRARIGIEDRFEATISAVSETGDQAKAVATLVESNDDTYNMVTGHDVLFSNLSLKNYFVNVYSLPYQDFEKPWWSSAEDLEFMGQLYAITSDMTYLALNTTTCIYINKQISKNYGIEVPYQQVFDGTWTIDNLISMSKDIYEDLNANSTADEEDLYGYQSMIHCYGYLEAFGIETFMRDGDTISVDFDLEKTSNAVSKVYDFLFESKGGRTTLSNAVPDPEFQSNRAMICQSFVGRAMNNYRHVEGLDYGILPMPKWDAAQEDYYGYTMHYPFFIPSSLPLDEHENTSILIEALSAEGYKQVFPAYFELALKTKYTTDDESVRVLDIINESKAVSFSWAFENWEGFDLCLYYIYSKGDDNFSSYYASNLKKAEKRAETVMEAFEKMAVDQGLR